MLLFVRDDTARRQPTHIQYAHVMLGAQLFKDRSDHRMRVRVRIIRNEASMHTLPNESRDLCEHG